MENIAVKIYYCYTNFIKNKNGGEKNMKEKRKQTESYETSHTVRFEKKV